MQDKTEDRKQLLLAICLRKEGSHLLKEGSHLLEEGSHLLKDGSHFFLIPFELRDVIEIGSDHIACGHVLEPCKLVAGQDDPFLACLISWSLR